MRNKKKLLLQKELFKYSLVAGGMLSGIEANVVTTNVDTTLTNTQTLDIDFEGTDGVDITITNFYFTGPPAGNAMFVAGNASDASFLGTANATKFFPYALTQNNNIPVTPATGTWGKGGDNIGTLTYDMYGSTRGVWANQSNKYLGVKFDISGATHYGWVLISVNSSSDEITIHSYAYETIANTGISSPLPVELTSFTAILRDKSVELNWETATEVNNYGFEIERNIPLVSGIPPSEGKNEGEWETIGFVQGQGNCNSPRCYSFIDINPTIGSVYYRLKQIDFDGAYEYSNTVEISFIKSLTKEFVLNQNNPNPFNPNTVISYTIPTPPRPSPSQGEGVREGSFVSLKIYDMLGNEIKTLVNERQKAGSYTYNFNGTDLASGTYIYQLVTGRFSETKKMLLIK